MMSCSRNDPPVISGMRQSAAERELDVYCKSREGEVKLARAAHKLREKADLAWQMDGDAAKKGIAKISKAQAKAQARLEYKTEMYMRSVQKVSIPSSLRVVSREI